MTNVDSGGSRYIGYVRYCTGDFKTFHQAGDGRVFVDHEGYLGGDGGYPYICFPRRPASEMDLRELNSLQTRHQVLL